MLRKASSFWVLLALALSSSLVTASWGRANETATEFNIPPQSLDSALLVFAEQGDVQVSVATVSIAGLSTQGVVGRFTPSAALGRLLDETGLKFTTTGDRTYSVLLARKSGEATTGTLGASQEPHSANVLVRLEQSQERVSERDGVGADRGAVEQSAVRPEAIIDEMVVTGTHIPGEPPVGSNRIVIDREYIDRTGSATVAQVLRTISQNFAGGPNEATWFGAGTTQNTSLASGINLRGLGAGATLVLLNGRRMAPAGLDASFVDIASIPLSAIERIDVLTDGASAIYGSDAIGGVVNMVLRRDYDGAETTVQVGVPTDGGGRSEQAAQSLGLRWGSGDALISYEYFNRDAVLARERELTASSDLRPQGGGDFRSIFSNPGTIFTGLRTWAIPAGQDGTGLTAGDFVEGTRNLGNNNEVLTVLPEQERHSVLAAINQDLGDRIQLFVNGLFSERDSQVLGSGFVQNLSVPSTNAFYVNPAGGMAPLSIRYNFVDDLGPNVVDDDVETSFIAAGVEVRAGSEWRASVEGNYGFEDIDQLNSARPIAAALSAALADSNPTTAFNPFADGSSTNPATLASIAGTQLFASQSSLASATATASGPVFTLPAGDLYVALGGEHRRQEFDTFIQTATESTAFLTATSEREVTAGFAEVRVPLFGQANSIAGFRALNLSLAARYERYSDFGDTTVPKVGLEWRPIADLTLFGSWGESFKAPPLASLNEGGNFISLTSTPSPMGGASPILIWSGGNRDLSEETADSWAAGLSLASSKGFRLRASYFEIDFDDRILAPPFGSFLIDPILANFVILNPTAAQRAEVCSRGTFLGAPGGCLNAPIAAIVDSRPQNVATVHERGLDFEGLYDVESAIGHMQVGLNATYLLELEQAQLPTSPLVEVLNTPRNPIDLKLRGSLSWNRGPLSAATFINHVDSYDDTVSVPARSIDAWTTVDLQFRYDTDQESDGWLHGVSVMLNVQNLLDEEPPFFNNSAGIAYDATNADLMGRVVSARIRKSW